MQLECIFIEQAHGNEELINCELKRVGFDVSHSVGPCFQDTRNAYIEYCILNHCSPNAAFKENHCDRIQEGGSLTLVPPSQ
jgi:hypothetical protein